MPSPSTDKLFRYALGGKILLYFWRTNQSTVLQGRGFCAYLVSPSKCPSWKEFTSVAQSAAFGQPNDLFSNASPFFDDGSQSAGQQVRTPILATPIMCVPAGKEAARVGGLAAAGGGIRHLHSFFFWQNFRFFRHFLVFFFPLSFFDFDFC